MSDILYYHSVTLCSGRQNGNYLHPYSNLLYFAFLITQPFFMVREAGDEIGYGGP